MRFCQSNRSSNSSSVSKKHIKHRQSDSRTINSKIKLHKDYFKIQDLIKRKTEFIYAIANYSELYHAMYDNHADLNQIVCTYLDGLVRLPMT